MNHLFLIHDGTNSWYVADSGHAALALFVADQYGPFPVEDYAKECPDTTVALVPDDEPMTISQEQDDEIWETHTKSVREWVEESEPGLLASTDR